MSTFIKDVHLNGIDYKLCLYTNEELKAFFEVENRTHIEQCTQKGNSFYLNFSDEDFVMMNIVGLQHEGNIVCFCLRPSYCQGVLSRVYTTIGYRKNGLATYLIDWCETVSLSCLTDNVDALRLYKRLGFTVEKEFSWLLNLKRDPKP